MNDTASPSESPGDSSRWDEPQLDEVPQFGAVDIVEAFTAMRHEWRGQTKESRVLAEQVQAAVASLQSLESKLLACVADNRPDDASESRALALLIAETDHQLTRAIAAIAQWEANQKLHEAAGTKAVEQYFAAMNAVARWFARPLLTFMTEQRAAQEQNAANPAIEGLNLLLARLRREMQEHQIERIDAEGQVFDATLMNAIGTVASTDSPPGHVAEQLSPAYRWQGQLLRFAEVRVAR